MKNTTIPWWIAYKDTMPGPGAKPTLHIRGCVFATPCEKPYLKPLKEPEILLFELAIEKTGTGPCPQVEVPKEVIYKQRVFGNAKEVLIKMPGQKQPVRIPIKSVSFK
jgi:hypothetical protein